jgi:hypothetical protein
LCKQAEGSIPPLFVEALKHGINDSIYALWVDKAEHWSRPAAHLRGAALNQIAGAQLPPQVPEEAEEGTKREFL